VKKRWHQRVAESLRHHFSSFRLRRKGIEEVFTEIYRKNEWGSEASGSGSGSDLEQTRVIARELPILWRKLGVTTILDIPCGDFGWMSTADLSGFDYLGGDIVEDLVRSNREKHSAGKVQADAVQADKLRFEVLNLTAGPLPKVDLIFCRDCLPHFSFEDLRRALNTIVESDSTYLLTTTFTNRPSNRDIATGHWRPLNLQAPPFNLPAPVEVLLEECTEADGAYRDKALGLWRVEDLRETTATAQPL